MDESVLDAVLGKEAASLIETQQEEARLWRKWDARGRKPQDLAPLMRSLAPLIQDKVNVYAGKVPIPPASIRTEFQQQALRALKTYRPDKGAKLNTWVQTNLRKGQRYITTYQNLGRIQEDRVYKIGTFNTTKDLLTDELGREPTSTELSDRLKWHPKEVATLELELRKDLRVSGFGPDGAEPSTVEPSREAEVLRLVAYELTPEEKLVYEYSFGVGGKQRLRSGAIAKKLGMSASKVSRLRGSIADKMKRYLH